MGEDTTPEVASESLSSSENVQDTDIALGVASENVDEDSFVVSSSANDDADQSNIIVVADENVDENSAENISSSGEVPDDSIPSAIDSENVDEDSFISAERRRVRV